MCCNRCERERARSKARDRRIGLNSLWKATQQHNKKAAGIMLRLSCALSSSLLLLLLLVVVCQCEECTRSRALILSILRSPRAAPARPHSLSLSLLRAPSVVLSVGVSELLKIDSSSPPTPCIHALVSGGGHEDLGYMEAQSALFGGQSTN